MTIIQPTKPPDITPDKWTSEIWHYILKFLQPLDASFLFYSAINGAESLDANRKQEALNAANVDKIMQMQRNQFLCPSKLPELRPGDPVPIQDQDPRRPASPRNHGARKRGRRQDRNHQLHQAPTRSSRAQSPPTCPPRAPMHDGQGQLLRHDQSRQHHQRNLRDGPAQKAQRHDLAQVRRHHQTSKEQVHHAQGQLPRRHGLRGLVDYTPSPPDHQG